MRVLAVLTGICLGFLLTGCGGGGGGGGGDTASEEVDLVSNPVVQTQFFGHGGNLWKPFSDAHSSGGGNLVVLLSAQFSAQFHSCEVPLRDGTVGQLMCINNQPWTMIPYSCFSNGKRQTWRANFTCWDAAEVKVICRDDTQEVVFTVPEAQRGHICDRFG